MKKIFKEAHKMTREMVEKYGVDYQAQFGLCLAYLLENKEEEKMIKWIREDGKVLEFDVKDTVKFYANGEYMGSIKYVYPLGANGNRILEFNNVKAKNQIFKLKITDDKVAQEILAKVEENKATIDNLFKNLDNVELEGLSNGSIVLKETEQIRELKELNKDYFYKVSEDWISNNKRAFAETVEWIENGMGMMESKTTYFFTKENKEKSEAEFEEYKKTDAYNQKLENEKRFNELCKMAETMSDIDFEDVTGLPREYYLI